MAGIGGDDRIYVTTKDKTDSFLISPERTHEGIELVKVNWSPEFGKTTVTVRKAGETATLQFDLAALSAAPASAGNPGGNAPPPNARPTTISQAAAANSGARTPPPSRARLIRPPRTIRSVPSN